jgi:predicted MPP superfamily phosphohydrolase
VLYRLVLRNLPDVIGLTVVLLIQAAGAFWFLRMPAVRASSSLRRIISIAIVASFAVSILAFLLRFSRVTRHFSPWWSGWGRGMMMAWALINVMLVVSLAVSHLLPGVRPEYSPLRRNFLRAAHVALFGAPAVAVGYGVFIERFDLKLREVSILVPGLAPDLDGLKIVQLTDIHLSPFLSVEELDRAIAMANETRANVALVTGDLISTEADPVDLCLDRLTALRADAGIFGCLGNHEIYAGCQDHVARRGAQMGMHFLRLASQQLKFGNAVLNLAGVDYQHFGKPYLPHAEKLVVPGAYNVLMSHNPDVFPVAARQGWQFTIAGHTHGGQVRVEILRQDLNIARFFTPFVDGIYSRGPDSIFVSRGIGTIGVPARLGAPPEVALIRLCRT